MVRALAPQKTGQRQKQKTEREKGNSKDQPRMSTSQETGVPERESRGKRVKKIIK